MKSIFITGTGTNIGKTFVAALLAVHAVQKGQQVFYHKPIQTGSSNDNDALTVDVLSGKGLVYTSVGLSFKRPLSPHAAAHYDNSAIDFTQLVARSQAHKHGEVSIFEGAGGLLVPLNARYFMADLIKALETPVVLVASSGLGTINHTLMSLAVLKARHILIGGIALVGDFNRDNLEALRFYSGVRNIISLPWLNPLDHLSLWALADSKHEALNIFWEHIS